jgi:hypothetical protein
MAPEGHNKRRGIILDAFQQLKRHEVDSRGGEVRRLSPSVFLWGALALTGRHRVDKLDANLRADVAAEFLIDEATARHGITKEFALQRFDQDADLCTLTEGDFLYFFGVEGEDASDEQATSESPVGGVSAADLLLFRSVPLTNEPLMFLAAYLEARLLHVRSVKGLAEDEQLMRQEVHQLEFAARDELQSTSRRRLYAAALRSRLAEDRRIAQQQHLLKSIRDDSEKDTAELQNLKWEQEAVQRSIEATRDAAVKLEMCLQDTHQYVRRCGDQFGVFKQYKETLLQLCSNEVQDDMTAVLDAVHAHHDKWGSRFDAVEDKIRQAGRVIMLTSASKGGRVKHTATLEVCNAAHKKRHDGEPVDYSWLLDPTRPSPNTQYGVDGHHHEDDDLIARWMLRDPTIFVPPSVLGPQHNLQLTKDSVSIIQRVFNRLALISSMAGSGSPSTGAGLLPKDLSTAAGISFTTFKEFSQATGLCRTVSGFLTLEFESFCPLHQDLMDYEGWLQCLSSQATLLFPRFAASISRPLLMDVLCTSLLVPWLHADASRGDMNSPIPPHPRGAEGRSVVAHSALNSFSQRRHSLCFDAKELIEEAIGALFVAHRTLEVFLQMFSLQASDYPAAPMPRTGNDFLRSAEMLSLSRTADIAALEPSAAFEAPALMQSLQLGAHCLTSLRNVLNERLAMSSSLHKGGGTDATMDACCGWLSVHLPLEAVCPPRHILLLLIADSLVRIVQASFASRTEGPLSLWPYGSVSGLLFNGSVIPALLDVEPSGWAAAASGVPEEATIHIESTCIGAAMFMAMVALLSHQLPDVIPSLEDILCTLCDD